MSVTLIIILWSFRCGTLIISQHLKYYPEINLHIVGRVDLVQVAKNDLFEMYWSVVILIRNVIRFRNEAPERVGEVASGSPRSAMDGPRLQSRILRETNLNLIPDSLLWVGIFRCFPNSQSLRKPLQLYRPVSYGQSCCLITQQPRNQIFQTVKFKWMTFFKICLNRYQLNFVQS